MGIATAPATTVSRPEPRPGERVGILFGSYSGMEMTAAWSEEGKWCLAPDGEREPIRWFARDEIAPLGVIDADADRLEPAAWRRIEELSDPESELRLMHKPKLGTADRGGWYAIAGADAEPSHLGWGLDRLGALASLLAAITDRR